jgi:cardiolipin synthase (CMP-forming)
VGSNPAVPTREQHVGGTGAGQADAGPTVPDGGGVASGPAEEVAAYRVVTVPNALSVLRLLGVPLFLWLLLGPHADVAALVVLALSGLTDWADGVLARKLNQTSKLGALLDPAVDRLYILATLIGLTLRHIIPWWLAAVIIARDLLLLLTLPVLRRHGYGPPPVHYLGKAATFNLLYAFPLLLLAARPGTLADIARPIAWAFTIWGTALYLWAGALYLVQVSQLTRRAAAT